MTGVLVPKVYDDYTTRKLLVSEWIDGVKLSQCDPAEIKDLIAIGQECFLVQLLQVGFFHSDPHPGNLMRPDDDADGKLVLIDFGLVAQVEQEDMDAMVSSIVHLANKDYAVASIANSVLKRMIARKVIDASQVKTIYRSQTFPTTGYGHAHNLDPSVVAKIKQAFFSFKWEGSDLKKEFKKEDRFIAINHKHDWDVIRKIDAANGVKYDCK